MSDEQKKKVQLYVETMNRYENRILAEMLWRIMWNYSNIFTMCELSVFEAASRRLAVADEPTIDDFARMLQFERVMQAMMEEGAL